MELNWPVEQQGSTGENVRSIQYLLNDHGSDLTVDGAYGPETTTAVRRVQADHGMAEDGVVGNQTWPVLIVEVSNGSAGDAVRAVQSQIHSRSGWLEIDGSFGPETDRTVRFFQEDVGLTVDGIVGPHTWNALVSAYLRARGDSVGHLVYDAWSRNDRWAAAMEAMPQAVAALFARSWDASDGWSFVRCEGAMGHLFCKWQRSGEQLVLRINDNAGAPFYFVEDVSFETGSQPHP